jgi:hypothetical protein
MTPPLIAGGVTAGVAHAIASLPVLDLAYFFGIFVAAVASLVVVAFIAVYLVKNNPKAFLKFRKLRPEPKQRDDEPPEE